MSAAISQSQTEANAYWAGRAVKKYVVTLERGPIRSPAREIKYVSARTTDGAVACAIENAFTVTKPTRVSCRLATAYDLGCTRTAHVQTSAPVGGAA